VSANLDLLRKGYDDAARGDFEAATESWPDDLVMEGPNATESPMSGVHEGKEAVARAMGETIAEWDEQKVIPDEFIEQGDTIVVLAHAEARKGDQSTKLPVVHVWRFSNGEPRRWEVLYDTLDAARTLGLV
jgi:uncharacterized protein